jgi:SAM-dependent methyltransferase
LTPPGWPFFAPASGDAVEAALDLAGLQAGEHLVDLGCGDGQVLVAAARRGARVTGVEIDDDLAVDARQALADAGVPDDRGRVVVADLFDPALFSSGVDGADVLFSYLSPATLQRLTPTLRDRPAGTRLVTVDFAVPDLVPAAVEGPAQLYRLPGRWRRPRRRRIGWPTDGAGTLCIAAADVSSLSCLTAVHAGGPVRLQLTGEVAGHAAVAAGTDEAEPGGPVAVDIRWTPRPAGTLATGAVCVDGLPVHPLTVLFTDATATDHGQWNLTDEGCESLAARLADSTLPPPTTAADLLDAL